MHLKKISFKARLTLVKHYICLRNKFFSDTKLFISTIICLFNVLNLTSKSNFHTRTHTHYNKYGDTGLKYNL